MLQDGPRNCQPLAFAATERRPVLSGEGVQAERQAAHDLIEQGNPARLSIASSVAPPAATSRLSRIVV